ncbi:MAG: glycosyltransferase family 9 protein [bacterium]|nr:glycosyltransferase family 9 protein [bacterium]MDD5354468.1 glycosyltransferase family 9 protein [bacterium]MDD5755697.1 glycosyltransferase family 9 protein [bacterium]
MQRQKIKNILALSTTGLGNLVLYTPVLRALRRDFPESHITLLVASKTAGNLMAGCKEIDEVIVINKSKINILYWLKIIKHIRNLRADLVITSFLDKSFKVALFSRLTGARYRVGYKNKAYGWLYSHQVPITEKKHEIEYNLDLVRVLGLAIRRANEKAPFISITPLEEELANDFLLKNHVSPKELLVGVHPGSGLAIGSGKRWSREKFARLCDLILTIPKTKVIVFGGQEERYAAEEMAKFMRKKPIIIAGDTDIRMTTALIKRSVLFISNDSGLMHLATAVKTPVLAIFGPTLWWKNSPWGLDNVVIRKEMACAPCYNYQNIECKTLKCLEMIKVEEAWQKVKEMLND